MNKISTLYAFFLNSQIIIMAPCVGIIVDRVGKRNVFCAAAAVSSAFFLHLFFIFILLFSVFFSRISGVDHNCIRGAYIHVR